MAGAPHTPNPRVSNPLAPDWLDAAVDVNALWPGLWSRNTVRATDGQLVIAGVSASQLVEQFGTPLYVMDEDDARARALEVREAFERELGRVGAQTIVYYAAKAFLCTEVARWVTEAGMKIDVASGGELAVALAAGVAPARMGFHGNNKSQAEIDRAVGVGVDNIVIDSLWEIDRVAESAARHGVTQRVRLRVNSGVHAHTHSFLATAHEDQKFGVTIADAPAHVARIREHPSLT